MAVWSWSWGLCGRGPRGVTCAGVAVGVVVEVGPVEVGPVGVWLWVGPVGCGLWRCVLLTTLLDPLSLSKVRWVCTVTRNPSALVL